MYKILQSIIIYIFHLFIVFGFIFEMPLSSSLTTRRISLVFAILTLIIKRKDLKLLLSKVNNNNVIVAITFFLILMIQILILSIGVKVNSSSSYIEPWYMLYIILYVLLFALYSVVEFKTVKSFLLVYAGCFLIQAFAVFIAAVNTPFRLLLYELFYFGDDRFERSIVYGTRIMGINLHSSTGSIYCSTSIVLLTYCYLRKYIKQIIYLILSFIFIAMTAFIGRTGVLIELICIIYAMIYGNKNHFKSICIVSLFSIILIFAILKLTSNSDISSGESLINWMTDSFSSEGRKATLDGINRTLPPLSLEFVFGTTVMTGITSNGTSFSTDSGYVMMYGAVGIIGSMLYYIAFLNLYSIGGINKNNRIISRFLILIIILSYLIEYKEPFMMKYIFSYMILVISLFSLAENNKIIFK